MPPTLTSCGSAAGCGVDHPHLVRGGQRRHEQAVVADPAMSAGVVGIGERPDRTRRRPGRARRPPLHRDVEPAPVLDHPPVGPDAGGDRGARRERAAQRDSGPRCPPCRPGGEERAPDAPSPVGANEGRRTARARSPTTQTRPRPPGARHGHGPAGGREPHGAREAVGRDGLRSSALAWSRSTRRPRHAIPRGGDRDKAGGIAQRRRGAAPPSASPAPPGPRPAGRRRTRPGRVGPRARGPERVGRWAQWSVVAPPPAVTATTAPSEKDDDHDDRGDRHHDDTEDRQAAPVRPSALRAPRRGHHGRPLGRGDLAGAGRHGLLDGVGGRRGLGRGRLRRRCGRRGGGSGGGGGGGGGADRGCGSKCSGAVHRRRLPVRRRPGGGAAGASGAASAAAPGRANVSNPVGAGATGRRRRRRGRRRRRLLRAAGTAEGLEIRSARAPAGARRARPERRAAARWPPAGAPRPRRRAAGWPGTGGCRTAPG